MNSLQKLSLLTLALVVGACNEKVSPELQGASSSTTTGGGGSSTPVAPSDFYFRVENKSDTMLNFKLHKTGENNANAKCEITSPVAFSSNNYRADLSTYDVTCFYEAEELSLWFNGMSFAVEASKNTCDYVAYGPFSYFNYEPGSSTDNLIEVTCSEDAPPPNQAAIDGAIPGTSADGMICGSMRSPVAVAGGASDFFKPDADSDLCRFDHTDNDGPNCDSGTIDVTSYSVAMTDSDGNGTLDLAVATSSTRKISCGGKTANCIEGPFKLEGFNSSATSGIRVTRTTLNKDFTKTYTYSSLDDVASSNRRYVNYRRDLASLDIEYGSSDRSSGTLSSAYLSSFGDPIYRYSYNPELMARYSDNKRMDGTTLVTSTHINNAKILNNKVETPFAAEPYVGLSGVKTNPFYTFYCFDNALDVKARIRMVVRDWDRIHSASPTDKSFERISDVDLLPPLARQDVPYTDEITGEPDSWNAFNDIEDWDDFIDMERDDAGIGYDPTITVWRPVPDGTYTETLSNGFINPRWFPKEEIN